MDGDAISHLGHNSLSAAAAREIDDELARFRDRAKAIEEAEKRVVIDDEDTAGRASDFAAQARALAEEAGAARDRVREPYKQASDLVTTRALRFAEPLQAVADRVIHRIGEYRRFQREKAAEDLRLQQGEEARLRAAAAARQAPSAPAPAPAEYASDDRWLYEQRAARPAQAVSLPATRGDYGSRVHDRKVKVVTIDDPRALPDAILLSDKVQEAMKAVCRDMSKHMKVIPGATITTDIAPSHRR
jgi:hypothetical protein